MQVMDSNLSALGQALWQIAATHGITSKSKIWKIAKEEGHDVSRGTVYNYLSGQQKMPRQFLQALDAKLHFTKEEKRQLVASFSQQVREDDEIEEVVRAAEEAFDLSKEESLKMGWVYLWGSE